MTGPVDRSTVVQIEILLRALSDAGASRLLVDLDGVSRCDPALSGAVNRVRRRLAPGDGWLIVDGAPPAVRDDVELSLPMTFRIYREATAVATRTTTAAQPMIVPQRRERSRPLASRSFPRPA